MRIGRVSRVANTTLPMTGLRSSSGDTATMRTQPRYLTVLLAAALVLSASACGSNTDQAPPEQQAPAAAAAQPAPTTPAPNLDAKTVLDRLTAAKVGLTAGAVQDEDTDPNNLLGRPNGYTGRASADLAGGDPDGEKYTADRGLVIEVFPATTDADARSKYIQDSLKSLPILGTEYHYRADEGRVLVRVTGKVKPSAAAKIEAAVGEL